MASYNYAAYIGQAMESVIRQTYPRWELLVVDDGSTDASLSLIAAYAAREKRIRPFFHPGKANKGLAETLQLGLSRAEGFYTAFLESDDLWSEDNLEQRLEALEAARCRVVFNDCDVLIHGGARTDWYELYLPRITGGHRRVLRRQPALDLRYSLLLENKIPSFSCAMLESDLLRSCSFKAPVRRWLDWWLWMQVSHAGPFAYVPEKLTVWRLHAASWNHTLRLKTYLRESGEIWRGFRAFARARKLPRTYRLLLAFPFYCRMLARLGEITTHCGVRAGFRAIMSRIGG
jgi:glycosyltransferase involved in cell wall biosynthesis